MTQVPNMGSTAKKNPLAATNRRSAKHRTRFPGTVPIIRPLPGPELKMSTPDEDPLPPGERFLYWLGRAARTCREEAGVRRETVAHHMNANVAVIERFELGRSMPRDLERAISCYAKLCGVEDCRDIFVMAVQMWKEHGSKPRFS